MSSWRPEAEANRLCFPAREMAQASRQAPRERKPPTLVRAVCLSCALCLASLAVAEPMPPPAEDDPKLTLRLGLFLAKADTRLGAHSRQDQSYFSTDFEDDLGLRDTTALPFAELEWRWSARWRLRLAYQRLDREGQGWLTLHDDNGGNLTQIKTFVDSHFKADALQVSVGYTLPIQAPWETVLLLGTHVTRLRAGVHTPDYSDDYHEKGWAPLPDVGLQVRQRWSSAWWLEGRLQYFPVRYERFEGSRREAFAALEYQADRHWGLGLGYAYSRLEADYRHARYDASLDYTLKGPLAYLSSRFY
jgi:hypothetical protein